MAQQYMKMANVTLTKYNLVHVRIKIVLLQMR